MYEYLTVVDGTIERYMIDIEYRQWELEWKGGRGKEKQAGGTKNRIVFDSYGTETEVNTKKHNGISAGVNSYCISTYLLRRARPSANLLSRAAVKPAPRPIKHMKFNPPSPFILFNSLYFILHPANRLIQPRSMNG
jgi:hypothetical protein